MRTVVYTVEQTDKYPTELNGISGAKALVYWASNVTAEAATHNDTTYNNTTHQDATDKGYLRDRLSKKICAHGKSLTYAAILFLGVCRS